jgi:hypothetical protein
VSLKRWPESGTGRAWIALAFWALVLWGGAQTIVKYDYSLGATDANMALYSTVGALLTLGVYGLWKGRAGTQSLPDDAPQHCVTFMSPLVSASRSALSSLL